MVASRPLPTRLCTAPFTSPESAGTLTGVGCGVLDWPLDDPELEPELEGVVEGEPAAVVVGAAGVAVAAPVVDVWDVAALPAVAWPSETLIRTWSPDFSVPPAAGLCASTCPAGGGPGTVATTTARPAASSDVCASARVWP